MACRQHRTAPRFQEIHGDADVKETVYVFNQCRVQEYFCADVQKGAEWCFMFLTPEEASLLPERTLESVSLFSVDERG